MRFVLALVLVVTGLPSAALAQNEIPANIRSESTSLREAVQLGVRRSPTFRTLVYELARSNLIIYLETNFRLPHAVNGILRLVTTAGGFRYVRVSLTPRLMSPALAEMIGHELKHAVELARATDVIDQAGMARLYGRIGFPCGTASTFDTEGAIHIQAQVRNELRAHLRELTNAL